MIISGLVIQYDPALTQAVIAGVGAMAGISELTILESSCRIACVLECPNLESSTATIERLLQIEGIVTAMPTYLHELEEA